MYDKSTAKIILNGEKLKAFPLRSGTRQGCFATFQHCTGHYKCNESRKDIEGVFIGKEEIKLLFADYIIIWVFYKSKRIDKILL